MLAHKNGLSPVFRPYVCVVCEKVIVGKDEVASVIGLFSKFIVNKLDSEPLPADAAIPKEWAIFTIWDVDPEAEGRNFSACSAIYYPDKSQFGPINKINFTAMKAKTRAQVYFPCAAFPIGQLGTYFVNVWLEENDNIVTSPIELRIEVELNK